MKATKYAYFAAISLSIVLSSCRGQTSRVPPVHPNLNMDMQRRFEPQEENDFFADKRAMRQPVEGTIARSQLRGAGDQPYYQGINPDSSFVQENPVELTKSFLYRGQSRYEVFCTPCHGKAGDGKGIIMEGGYGYVPAPSYHQERLRNVSDGYIYSAISNGIRNMPAYAHQIGVRDRWAIVAYVRALQKSQHVTEDDIQKYNVDLASLQEDYKQNQAKVQKQQEAQAAANEGVEVSAEQGRTVAENNACLTCHSVDGSELTGPTWQNAFGHEVTLASGETVMADEAYITESILKSTAKIVEGFQGVMPNYDYLNDSQVQSLVAYIKSLSDAAPPENEESESTDNSAAEESDATSANQQEQQQPQEESTDSTSKSTASADTSDTSATKNTQTLSASALSGQKLFKEFACLSCHTIDGSKELAPAFKGLFGSKVEFKDGSFGTADEGYIKESIQYPGAKVVLGFNSNMPSYRDLLTDADLQAITDYIKTLQ